MAIALDDSFAWVEITTTMYEKKKKKKPKLTPRVVYKPLIWQMVETTRG